MLKKFPHFLPISKIAVAANSIILATGMASTTSYAAGGISADSTQGPNGTGQVSVHLDVTFSSSGANTSTSSSLSTTVKPSCYFEPGLNGPDMAKLDSSVATHDPNHRRQQQIDAGIIPDYQKHKDDTTGKWWTRHCDPDAFPDQESYKRAVAEYEGKATTIWVDQGNQPPAPSVSGATLANAAWQATTIPNPTIDTNPKVGESNYTILGIDTWVWATGETPKSVQVTATAGGTSATVTAGSSGLQLSAPDSKPSCQGFGIPWHRGMPEGSSPCTIVFNRSSAHLGGTTPLSVSVAYSASYTATDGSAGTLPSVTTSNVVNIPVAEIQTLTTKSRKK